MQGAASCPHGFVAVALERKLLVSHTLIEAKPRKVSSEFSARIHFPGSVLARFLNCAGGAS